MSTVKIRVYKAEMETRHGVDFKYLFDDPINPKYKTEEDITNVLMIELGYKEDENGNGYHEEEPDRSAWFEYHGYCDVEIPQSIVDRVRNEVSV